MSEIMTPSNRSSLIQRGNALVCGILFGTGLVISQMVNPQKVLNFLDITGHWDPSLMFVMIGALVVYGIGYWVLIDRRLTTPLGESIPARNTNPVDKNLIIGAVLFGVGWGLSGFCPGPAMTNASSLDPKIAVFLIVMMIGMKVGSVIKSRLI